MHQSGWMKAGVAASVVALITLALLLGWKTLQASSSPAAANRQLRQMRSQAPQAPPVAPPADFQSSDFKTRR